MFKKGYFQMFIGIFCLVCVGLMVSTEYYWLAGMNGLFAMANFIMGIQNWMSYKRDT